MDENKTQDPIPETFENIEAAAEFWDKHSIADYEDQLQEVTFEVRAPRRRHVALAPEVWEQVVSHARMQGILPETLVNLWLMERAQAV